LGSAVVYEIQDNSLPAALRLAADDHISGNPAGTVVLFEYLDFECPVCLAYRPVVDSLISTFPDLMVVYRHFPIISVHLNAFEAAVAVEAAHRQGFFDAFGDLLFTNQSEWNDSQTNNPQTFFDEYATELGMNLTQFHSDIADPALTTRVQRDLDAAIALGGAGAPTFFLQGVKITNPASQSAFNTLIQNAIDAVDDVFTLNRQTGQIRVLDSAALDFETTPNFPMTFTARGLTSGETINRTIHLIDVAESSPLSAPLSSLDEVFGEDDDEWTDLLD
jgi:protein-disulfide isomerase